MKKLRIPVTVMAVFFLLTTLMPYGASWVTQKERITYRSIGVVVDGNEITPCDVTGASTEPFIRNKDESTYLPVRAVSGALGLDVGWDDETSTVILNSGGSVTTGEGTPVKHNQSIDADLTFRGISIMLDGQMVELKNALGEPTEPFIKDDSTYLPVRAVAEALGCEVGWDDETSSVILTSSMELRIGQVISFGSYEQDNDPSNGTEPIQWIVKDIQDEEVLLVSRYCLDAKAYNENEEESVWESCTLRSWLNEEFFQKAFSSEEQDKIVEKTIQNPDSYWGYDKDGIFQMNNTGIGITDVRYHQTGGNETEDHLFLLSIDEAKNLLGYDTSTLTKKDGSRYVGHPGMQAAVTPYAAAQNALLDENTVTAKGESCCWWSLRSPAGIGNHSAHVDPYGSIGFQQGADRYGRNQAVRPAMWIHYGMSDVTEDDSDSEIDIDSEVESDLESDSDLQD